MKVSPIYYDEIFHFKGQWDLPSCCGLKIREIEGKTYVIVTELYQENTGTSVTYAGKSLALQVCEAKGLTLSDVVYLECTPDTNSKLSFYDEKYFVVDFEAELQNRYAPFEDMSIIQHLKVGGND
ncbi:hypothetical protein LJB85_02255 [Porphyromonadaceae bacterium OttesenSCG-928-L07]|nr:hypothetical protein [Porphyromonadaceae bacterium OttesenSCG-928-L07]MDL2251993.1 hypothetical protein [Odoribacter sp. OttesenSCG-928-J03]MDL2330825.1 hypothetical protein [Odoribacter sp. OttesenSCG-928-A06]